MRLQSLRGCVVAKLDKDCVLALFSRACLILLLLCIVPFSCQLSPQLDFLSLYAETKPYTTLKSLLRLRRNLRGNQKTENFCKQTLMPHVCRQTFCFSTEEPIPTLKACFHSRNLTVLKRAIKQILRLSSQKVVLKSL